ncbi:MAG: hypothetical protein RL088_2158 [Verrucomicrobiota bacterium]
MRASQAGNANYFPAADVDQTFSAATIPQVISFTNPGAKTFGDAPFGLVATGGGSGNPVTFSIVSGPATVSGSTLTITGAGSVTVRASQAGNGNYAAAPDVDQTFVVGTASQSITFGPLGGKTFGDAPFTVSATGGASGEPVTFSATGPVTIAGNLVTITGVGGVTITAHQAGNVNYAAAPDVSQSFTVSQASQAITFSLPARVATTSNVTLSATGSGSGNPVTFSLISGPGSLTGNSLTFTGVGTVVVRASQAGNVNYLAAPDVDASTDVVVNSDPVAADDAVISTTGTTTLYPLANDTDADSDELTIVSVTGPGVIVDGRALIIPPAFTGTFSYTMTDGIATDTADVVVTAGTP